MELLYFCAPLALYFATVFRVGYFIFSPFHSIFTSPPVKGGRWQLCDFLSAFLPFQIGFALINAIFTDISWHISVASALSGGLLIISTLSSLYGMRILWRSDIQETRKRVALLGFLMPFGFVVPLLAFPILMTSESVFSLITRAFLVFLLVGESPVVDGFSDWEEQANERKPLVLRVNLEKWIDEKTARVSFGFHGAPLSGWGGRVIVEYRDGKWSTKKVDSFWVS